MRYFFKFGDNDLMSATIRRSFFIVLLILLCGKAKPQNAPIGAWESHLPYSSAIGLATDGNTLYTLCNQSFFSLNGNDDNSYTSYSKTDGMADMGMQYTAYDMATSTLVLAYSNGNIDLFKDNTFYNVPGLKQKVVSGSKKIYQVYTDNGVAYLATALGIISVDLTKHIVENIVPAIYTRKNRSVYSVVTGFARSGGYFYAATENGLFRINKDDPQIQNANSWKSVDSTHAILHVTAVNNDVWFASANAVYKLNSDTLQLVYKASTILRTNIRHIDAGIDGLLISEYSDSTFRGAVKVLNQSNIIADSISCKGKPAQATQLLNKTIWIADSTNGLQKNTGGGDPSYHFPDGPSSPYSFDLYARNKELYIAHGEINRFFGGNFTSYGISYLHDGKWKLYKGPEFPGIQDIRDIVTLAKDESTDIMYAASFLNGLVILKPGDKISRVNENSIFDGSYTYGPDYKQLIGLGLDKQDNLWVTLANSDHPLYVKTKDSVWYKYKLPDASFGGPLVVDDSGQVYFASYLGTTPTAGGILVFNPSGTLADTADDGNYHMRAGKGYGNLPSNNVLCLVKDKNNEIWAGTDNGIAIIKSCRSPFTQTAPCDAIIPTVQSGANPGPLFAGTAVNTIAVDEANRKWIGTDDGVWLLSADGQNVIYRFNTENSPLPSDQIQKITVDKVTGDVYFGTGLGLVSYRDAITEPGTSAKDAFIFPNPVPAGYKGEVAIRGLPTDAQIRVTDVSGHLVYATKVQAGGQAVWNGMDYTGHRPQSGVYLVFITGNDAKDSYTGKIIFLQ